MRADNSAYLIIAASRRRELARSKALRAISELDAAGTPVTFESVARAARVSRSWLYSQPDIRAEVQRLRHQLAHALGQLRAAGIRPDPGRLRGDRAVTS